MDFLTEIEFYFNQLCDFQAKIMFTNNIISWTLTVPSSFKSANSSNGKIPRTILTVTTTG